MRKDQANMELTQKRKYSGNRNTSKRVSLNVRPSEILKWAPLVLSLQKGPYHKGWSFVSILHFFYKVGCQWKTFSVSSSKKTLKARLSSLKHRGLEALLFWCFPFHLYIYFQPQKPAHKKRKYREGLWVMWRQEKKPLKHEERKSVASYYHGEVAHPCQSAQWLKIGGNILIFRLGCSDIGKEHLCLLRELPWWRWGSHPDRTKDLQSSRHSLWGRKMKHSPIRAPAAICNLFVNADSLPSISRCKLQHWCFLQVSPYSGLDLNTTRSGQPFIGVFFHLGL